MADAKLKFNDGEIVLSQAYDARTRAGQPRRVRLGRERFALSRRNRMSKRRFWLIDLGSSNGTTLNGEAVRGDKKLNDGDEILLGGTSRAKFYVGEKKIEKTPAATERENSAVSNNEARRR
jgi:hypothetical protein